MAKKAKKESNLSFYIAVAAMVLLIYAISLVASGSLLQLLLILAGAFALFASATMSKQRVLQALELIIVVGIVLGILKAWYIYSLITILAVAAIMVAYLFSIEHYKKEPIGSVGSIGFILMAIGFAFDNGSFPLVTGFSLASGAILIAIYSITAYWMYKIKLQIVIAVLNVIFAISPLIMFLNAAGL